MTLSTVALRMDCSITYLSWLELGQLGHWPTLNLLTRLAVAIEVEFTTLVKLLHKSSATKCEITAPQNDELSTSQSLRSLIQDFKAQLTN